MFVDSANMRFQMKYFILSNSAVICVDDKTYTISNNDYRYKQVKNCLLDGDFEKAKEIVQPNVGVRSKDFSINNGMVYYKGSAIPTVLGNQFLEFSENSWEFKSIFNFWYNIKTRTKDAESSEIINELISKKAYAVTEDGFYLVYTDKNADQTKNKLNKKNKKQVFHFYNYANCPNEISDFFDKKQKLDDIILEIFGFCTKKLKKILLDKIFNENNNFINYNYFFYGILLKDVLANDNIVYCLEKDILDVTLGNINSYKSLKSFLMDFSIEKNGIYNQKRIINFLSNEDKNNILEVGMFYNSVIKNINVNFESLNFSNNLQEIHAYFQKEFSKIKDPVFDLDNDSVIEALSDEEFGPFRVLVPKTNHDLREWSSLMNNCISSYAESVRSKSCQIIAIMDKVTNEMLYNIEISKKNIVQFLGKRNSSVDPIIKDKVVTFLKDKGLIFSE